MALSLQAMMSLDTVQFTGPLQKVQAEMDGLKQSINTGAPPAQLQMMNQELRNSAINIAKLPDLAKETGTSISDVTSKGRGLIQVMMGLEAASLGSLRGVLTSVRGLGGVLGEIGIAVGAVGASFAVGWKIGSWLEGLTGIGDKLWSNLYPVEQ
jgi:hypothetical protein